MGEAIFFKNDSFRNVFEKPANGIARAVLAALVSIAVTSMRPARPIDRGINRLPGDLYLLCLAFMALSRSVTSQVKMTGCEAPQRVDDLEDSFRSPPKDQQDGCFKSRWFPPAGDHVHAFRKGLKQSMCILVVALMNMDDHWKTASC
jgi:hypothetical protein